MITTTQAFQARLRAEGQKATRPRILVLQILAKAKQPLTIEAIAKLAGEKANLVTLYRMMKDLQKVGMVRQVDFQHGHAHYELKTERDHHHIICEKCERVENIAGCDAEVMIRRIAKRLRSFASIRDHSFELFGICKACTT